MSKYLSLLLTFTTVCVTLLAKPVNPVITEVTVYRQGAKISSTANAPITRGTQEVVFENISPYFNANSLQVKIKGSGTLVSAQFRLKVPGPAPENPKAPILRDSLVLMGDLFVQIQHEREILTLEYQLIHQKMNQVGKANPQQPNQLMLTTLELQELAAFYSKRLSEIKKSELELTIRDRNYRALYSNIQTRLQQLNPNVGNQTGEIIMRIQSDVAGAAEITCTYLVTEAGWSPMYDLRSEGMGKPLNLVYKANISNRSGFHWNDVTLHLSTANPLMSNDRPILNPVYADFRPVYTYYKSEDAKKKDIATYNMAQAPAAADMARSRAAGKPEENEILDDEDGVFEEPPSNDDLITNFDLPKKQTILADGVENIVTIQEEEMPAEYEYHTVPKLDPAAFLLAKVTDYGRYNLLPGTANIFYQDTYIGQTWVNPLVTSDTLLLSLGRDEQIAVKRIQPKDFKEGKKILNNNVKEVFMYEITVKNNKSIPITIDVLDQIPVSKQADIKIELDEKSGAEYNEEFGKLKWQLTIPPNQSKKVRFSYSMKYPKGKPYQITNF